MQLRLYTVSFKLLIMIDSHKLKQKSGGYENGKQIIGTAKS